MNKQNLFYFLVFIISVFITFFVLVFFPRNRLVQVEVKGGVLNVKKMLLSKTSYLYVLRREYNQEGVVSDMEVGTSRLFEPGVYKDVSFGEIYLPKYEQFGNMYVYIYQEDGDMLVDLKKDKLAGRGVKVFR